jgi:hypothetical protein
VNNEVIIIITYTRGTLGSALAGPGSVRSSLCGRAKNTGSSCQVMRGRERYRNEREGRPGQDMAW